VPAQIQISHILLLHWELCANWREPSILSYVVSIL